MSTALQEIEQEKYLKLTVSLPDVAKAIEINDDASYKHAGDFLIQIKKVRATINETFDPIVKKAHEAHKEAINQKQKIAAPMEEAEKILKPKIAQYHLKLEQLKREREKEAAEEARKKAEEEQLNQAIEAEQSGNKEVAEEILSHEPIVNPIHVVAQEPKLQGVSFRDNWKADVTDIKLLLQAVLAGNAPMNVIIPNQVALNNLAKASRGSMQIPGVNFVCEKIVSGSSK